MGLARERDGTLATDALDVLGGAFRCATQAVAGCRGRGRIDVRIATVTAGIRGTDRAYVVSIRRLATGTEAAALTARLGATPGVTEPRVAGG